MSGEERETERVLGALLDPVAYADGPGKIPPPSPALEQAVSTMQPVRTRRPSLVFAGVLGLSLVYLAGLFGAFPLRRDFFALPRLWWWGLACTWLAGFLAALGVALLPKRRAVLPSASSAGRTALLVVIALIACASLLTRSAPPATLIPVGASATLHLAIHCLLLSVMVSVAPLLLGAWVLRGLVQSGGFRIGVALGAAGGALGGLLLHVICPVGGSLHVGVAHGGGVLVGALLGALLGALVLR